MQVVKSIHKILLANCPSIHRARLDALLTNVGALVRGHKLTVTALGRAAGRRTQPKHAIKQSDRLIGNPPLAPERLAIYPAITRTLLASTPHPAILVDWSDYTHDRAYVLLRASVPVGGRALTRYEEVHPSRAYGNTAVQRRFLDILQTILPCDATPTLVTAAGFIGPWFAEIRARGWQFVGRIRKNLLYRDCANATCTRSEALYPTATRQPRYHGPLALARSRPVNCHLYLVRQAPQGRHQRTLAGRRAARKYSNAHALRETSPGLIVTSLDPTTDSPHHIIHRYKTRRQIEQAFRDIKNTRAGFALREARSRSPQRLANLLLVGRLAIQQGDHYQLQANTVRNYQVLSAFFVACQLSLQNRLPTQPTWFNDALTLVHHDIARQSGA